MCTWRGTPTACVVRYRVDGVLQPAPSPPPHLTAAIVSRLKIMAELDIAERRLPQDGRIRLRLQNRPVDVRVSTAPTLRGESVVLRLLDKERGRISLTDLGMAADTLEQFTESHHAAARHRAGDRAHRLRQDHHAVRRDRRAAHRPREDPHGGGSGGVRAAGRAAGAGEREGRGDLRRRAAFAAAAGPGHHAGGRDPRRRDGADRDAGGAHRPPRALHAAHQRRPHRAHAPARPRRAVVPGGEHRGGRARAAARARDLPAVPHDHRPVTPGPRAPSTWTALAHRHGVARHRLRRTAAAPAIAGARVCTSC